MGCGNSTRRKDPEFLTPQNGGIQLVPNNSNQQSDTPLSNHPNNLLEPDRRSYVSTGAGPSNQPSHQTTNLQTNRTKPDRGPVTPSDKGPSSRIPARPIVPVYGPATTPAAQVGPGFDVGNQVWINAIPAKPPNPGRPGRPGIVVAIDGLDYHVQESKNGVASTKTETFVIGQLSLHPQR